MKVQTGSLLCRNMSRVLLHQWIAVNRLFFMYLTPVIKTLVCPVWHPVFRMLRASSRDSQLIRITCLPGIMVFMTIPNRRKGSLPPLAYDFIMEGFLVSVEPVSLVCHNIRPASWSGSHGILRMSRYIFKMRGRICVLDESILCIPWQSVHEAADLPSLSLCQWMLSLYTRVSDSWHFEQKLVTFKGVGFSCKFVCITFMETTVPLMFISPHDNQHRYSY